MSPVILWTGFAWIAFMSVVLIATGARSRARTAQKIARLVGLPLTPELESSVASSARLNLVVLLFGCVLGVVAASTLLVFEHETSLRVIGLSQALAVMAGLGLAAAVAAFAKERRRLSGTVRFARTSAVTLDDYRSRLDRMTPRIVVALLLIGLAVRVAASPRGTADVPPLFYVVAVLALLSLAVSEIANVVIVRRGQPAGSALDLAWDDALTSQALASIASAPIYIGAYGGLFSTTATSGFAHSGGAAGAALLQTLIALGAIGFNLVVVFHDNSVMAPQRYLRRLWPGLEVAREKQRLIDLAPGIPIAPAGGTEPRETTAP